MRIITSILFLFFCAALNAQSPKFFTEVDAKKIVEGSYVTVNFKLEGTEGNGFSPPSFKGFNVVSGPSQQNSMSIINGVVNKSLSYAYTVQPKAKGKIRIGSASIKTNSGVMKTAPVVIEVVKANKSKALAGKEIFMKTFIQLL